MNIYRVHCTVPPPFSKLQWQRWPPLVPRRSLYPPFSALSHPLSSALFAPLLLALRMALFLLHLLTRFASSPSWFCAQPPFRLTCLRARFALPFSCPLPPLSLFVFDLCSFVFAPPSPRLPFSCVSVRSPSRIWAIFPKKGRLVTDERMMCGAEGAAVGAYCTLTRHYARRVYLE